MDFVNLFETLKANVLPSMLENLSNTLGVSANALTTLGVGYLPIEGAWVFPERDNKGNIIGLLKRYQSSKKRMIDNSKRGLYYIVNSDYSKQSERHNWIRTTQEYPCPICGKTDWCLVSSECPLDPAAVICPRIEEGSTNKVGDAGWLHIRHKETKSVKSNKLLSDTKYPIIIVEGATDTLTAIDIGFVVVGKPSAEGGIETLKKVVAGKDVIIIGDNDAGAGVRGMEVTFNKLKSTCKSITKILPPPKVKDLREWHRQEKLTIQKFFDYVSEYGNTEVDTRLLLDPTPTGIAEQWLKENYTVDGILILRFYRNQYWKYINGRYIEIELDAVIQQLYIYLIDKYYIDQVKNVTVQFNPDKFKIQKIEHALIMWTYIKNSPSTQEPFVISNFINDIQFDKLECVIFKNGILNIRTNELISLTPKLFNTSTLPYDYDKDAVCKQWELALKDWFGKDTKSITLLAQWFGYNLIASNHYEKFMILFGPPASGKSTTLDALEAVLGSDRVTALDFDDIDSNFGLESLIGKHAALLSEDQVGYKIDSLKILQKIKRITGQDTMSIKRKYKSALSLKLFTRLTFATNELPQFVDNLQTLRRRVLTLYYPNTFESAPDIHLKQRITNEAQGIVNWALNGLRSLTINKNFIEPDSRKEIMEELKQLTSPFAAMIDECCKVEETGRQCFTARDILYDLHKIWFNENGYAPYNRIWFGRVVKNALPHTKEIRPLINNQQVRGYDGIEILPEIYERYLRRPK